MSLHEILISQLIERGASPIPDSEGDVFKPAELIVYEWTTYWLNLPGVEKLLVGTEVKHPSPGTWFQLKFENQLGLAKIQPFYPGGAVSMPVTVEVISKKFDTLQKHHAFYSTLLNDLYRKIVQLPFSYSAETSRGVVEALRPPTPLFMFHFLRQYSADLCTALAIILAAPHRLLIGEESYVPLGSASTVGPGEMLDMLQHTSNWVKAPGHPLAARLGGMVPTHIMQTLPQETYDTPENRFILGFLRIIQISAEQIVRQPWWGSVSTRDQQAIRVTQSYLQEAQAHPVLEEISEQVNLPFNSQVLLRKDGYRHMLVLWQKFQRARRPLFEPLHEAIQLRNIAALYEYWAFFALVSQIAEIVGVSPVLILNSSDSQGITWRSKANFGVLGTLVYNRTFPHGLHHYGSYSTSMRPDYTWEVAGKPVMIFDAKFSLSSQDLAVVGADSDENLTTRPSLADLYRMHTYRDALGVKSAVILYPGNTSLFFDEQNGKLNQLDLSGCFTGQLIGIGAISM